MDRFFIEFGSDDDRFTLCFGVHDTSLASRWFDCLRASVAHDQHPREDDRLYGFPANGWSEARIVDGINACIDAVNDHGGYRIDDRASVDCGQDAFNRLHTHFEAMRGSVLNPSELFRQAPDHLRRTIESYNVLIHRWENWRNNGGRGSAMMVVTFDDQPRYPLLEEDYDLFTIDNRFGDAYLSYCEVGKTLTDVFEDDDHDVGGEAIIPQRYYSSAFSVKFWDGHSKGYMDRFNAWWDRNEDRLAGLGFNRGDRHLSIGYIPVASIISDLPRAALLEAIGRFDRISRVYVA